jgi:hypothetical protein
VAICHSDQAHVDRIVAADFRSLEQRVGRIADTVVGVIDRIITAASWRCLRLRLGEFLGRRDLLRNLHCLVRCVQSRNIDVPHERAEIVLCAPGEQHIECDVFLVERSRRRRLTRGKDASDDAIERHQWTETSASSIGSNSIFTNSCLVDSPQRLHWSAGM